MGKFKTAETGLSILRESGKWMKNLPKRKINPGALKYVPPQNVSATSHSLVSDEFVHTTQKEFSTMPRDVSKKDILNFRQYVLMKKLNLKISESELRTLFAYEGEEFTLKAYELLTAKMNISKELMPKFVYSDAKGSLMFYDWNLNYIGVNPNLQTDKASFLGLLRHELQHFWQNMQVYRHETKGLELIELFTKKNTMQGCKNVDYYVKNVDLEQLKSTMGEEELKEITFLKDLLKNNQTAEYDNYMRLIEKEIREYHLSEYTKFRNKVIKNLGILKKDSAEGKRVEKMFNETSSEHSYWQPDGQVHLGKYLFDCRENEAIAAQDSIMINIAEANNTPRCYVNDLKQTQEYLKQNADKNIKLEKELDETIEGFKEKGIQWKDMISYLFD